jgi:hypothetical protein
MRSEADKIKRLERIAAKTKYSIRLKEYYAELRDDDIVFLTDNKYIDPKSHPRQVDDCNERIKSGRQWFHTFYFKRPLGTFKELLINKFVSDHGSSALRESRERL